MLCSCVSSSSKAARTPWGAHLHCCSWRAKVGTRVLCPRTHAHTHSSVKPCGWFSWKRKCWLKFLLLCLPSTEGMWSWSQRGPSCSLSWPGLNPHMGVAELQVTEQKGDSNSSGQQGSTLCASFHPGHSKNCAQAIRIAGREREGKRLT